MEKPLNSELLQRALERERSARIRAEQILEQKSRELYLAKEKVETQFHALRRRNSEVELLHTITMFSRETADPREAFQCFLEEVCRITGWPVGHVLLHDTKTEDLHSSKVWLIQKGENYESFRARSESMTFPKGGGLPGKVLASNAPVWIEDIFREPDFPRAEEARAIHAHAAFGVPIRSGDQLVGVAEFFATEAFKKDERILGLVSTAADQLGTELGRRSAEQKLYEKNLKLEQALKEVKETHLHLIQSEKMASLGQLAAGVAHEINNPVGFVTSNLGTLRDYANLLKTLLAQYERLAASVVGKDSSLDETIAAIRKLAADQDLGFVLEDLDKLLEESLEGTERVKEIVQGLKSFARVDEAQIKEASVNECIESTLKLVWNELKYKCQVIKKLGSVPSLRCYPGQLNQVFMNLLVNAAQAITDRGEIVVETQATESEILVRISDNGAGIAPENLGKLFNPFFTTKAVGKGTGLGLSISYGIIKKHGGGIEVQSVVGKGTTFTIRLPLEGVEAIHG